jgi:hypothetical protein
LFGDFLNYLESPHVLSDSVRPGEQWFFYWKTSAALWESRIQQFSQSEIIFIPLYWGFHSEGTQGWDFGKLHPERDLLRLVKLLTQHRRNFCWILPLSPAPFLPNGGVPVSAARTLSVGEDGVHLAALDHDKKLHKAYSFFEPKVFQAFTEFIRALGQFLSMHQLKAPLWGIQFQYHSQGQDIPFMNDNSVAFEQGFSRYLKKNYPQGTDLTKPDEEEALKKNFSQEVRELFQSVAQEILSPYWQGVQWITLLGAGPRDSIERAIGGGKSQLQYFQELIHHYLHNRWISSCLLYPEEKKELIQKFLFEHFGKDEIELRYRYQIHSGELGSEFRSYALMDIFCSKNSSHFAEIGLVPYLDKHFRWMYRISEKPPFTPDWIEANQQKIKIFKASGMDRTQFSQMLKLFMMGQKIVLDRTGLHPELEKRLQVFYLENNLSLHSINFKTTITLCELGEGRFITFEGDKLKEANDSEAFWSHLVRYFNLLHPQVVMEQDVFSLWRIRETSPAELNYLDVRRVNLYNPTSYKKQVVIYTQKKFAFMKMIDPSKASAKSTSEGVEVELLPNGRIALDFGHYEVN